MNITFQKESVSRELKRMGRLRAIEDLKPMEPLRGTMIFKSHGPGASRMMLEAQKDLAKPLKSNP